MRKNIELKAFLKNNEKIEKLHLTIKGVFRTEEDDYYCTVNIPLLFEKEKLIYGIDETQAKQLAVNFVKRVLDVSCIVDENGNSVDFCSIANEFFKQ